MPENAGVTKEKMPPIDVEVGRRLKRWRERLGITRTSVAEKAGVAEETLAHIEAGRRRLTSRARMGYWLAGEACRTPVPLPQDGRPLPLSILAPVNQPPDPDIVALEMGGRLPESEGIGAQPGEHRA